MNQNNPLKQYFRQPAIYINLPSQGKFYPPAAIEMPSNNEVPVYPMTAIDEITYRTPDALFNGQAVVNVIQSCIPCIKDAWAVPAMDVDTILVSIRIASYGHDMDFTSQCPNCGHEADHSLDLRTVLDKMKTPDYEKCMTVGDMEMYFKPMSYRNMNQNNKLQFEEQKTLQQIPEMEGDDVKKAATYSAALIKITQLTVKALAQSLASIKTPQAMVAEPKFLEEFLENCDRELFNRIRDHIIEIKSGSELQPLPMECTECKHKFEQPITLDMTSFFEDAS